MTTLDPVPSSERITHGWQDATSAVAAGVDLLLGQMTLEEKVAQLGSRWVGNDTQETVNTDSETTLNVAPMQDVFAASGTARLEDASGHGVGHLTRVHGSVPVTGAEGADLPLRTTVRLTGAERVVGHDRQRVTPVEIDRHPGSSGQ